MSDDNSDTADESNSLDDQPYGDLMNAARSAREQFDEVDIDTNAPKKDELIEAMDEQGVEKTDSGWEVDGEEVELLEVQTPDEYNNGGSSGPTDDTVLYCLTRAATTDERVEQIADALESETDYELQEAGSSGDKYSIVLPAEAQEGYEEPSEDDEDEESDETAESGAESDESDEEVAEQDEDEEPDESESDGADESEDEIDEGPPKAIARTTYEETLNDRNKTDIYQTATELDVSGRSDMTKEELIEAVADARVQDEDSPVVPDDEMMADA